MRVTRKQDTGNSRALPPGFVRAVLDDASYTDSLMDALEARLVALEEVAAGRGVRRLVLAWRLRRALRASIRPFAGRSFAGARQSRLSGWRRSQIDRAARNPDRVPRRMRRAEALLSWAGSRRRDSSRECC